MTNIERRAEQPKIEKKWEGKTPEEITEVKIESLLRKIESKKSKKEVQDILSKNPEGFREIYERIEKSLPTERIEKIKKELEKIVEYNLKVKKKEIGELGRKLENLKRELKETRQAATLPTQIALTTEEVLKSVKFLRELEKEINNKEKKLEELKANLDKLEKIKEKEK